MEPTDGTTAEVVADAPASAPVLTGDAALIAELDAMDGKASPEAPRADEQAGDAEPAAEVEPEAETAAAGESAKAEKAEPEKPESDDDLAKKDPALAKRLDVIARREKHQKGEHEKRVAELKKMESDLEVKATALKDFDAARSKARADLPAFLKSLGYKESEFLQAARILFGHHPGADEKSRAAAEEAIRGRHEMTQIETLNEKIERLERERKEEREQATLKERAAAYRNDLGEAAKKLPETSILRPAHGKNSAAIEERLYQCADQLASQLKRLPEPEEVIEAYEANLREELALFGIDLSKLNGTNPKTKTPDAGEKKTASPTLGNDLGSTKKPRPVPKTPEEAE